MSRHLHIIAASPSGAISQGSPTPESSAAGCGGEKTRYSFDETRRAIEDRLREGCRTKLREDRHVTVEPTWREDLADDWRAFIREVQASPYSHALVAIAAFFAGLLLIVVPAMIGAGVWS